MDFLLRFGHSRLSIPARRRYVRGELLQLLLHGGVLLLEVLQQLLSLVVRQGELLQLVLHREVRCLLLFRCYEKGDGERRMILRLIDWTLLVTALHEAYESGGRRCGSWRARRMWW